MDKIRVLVVDDHEIIRSGLRRLLELDPHMTVVGEASNGDQAMVFAAAMQPDVILMDIRMPGTDGVTATRVIKQSVPNVKILMLTAYSGGYLMKAIRAGADGFLSKDLLGAELIHAIGAAAGGKCIVHLTMPLEEMAELAADNDPARELTPRQKDLLYWLAAGSSNDDIAHRLDVSAPTVQSELKQVMQTLGVADRMSSGVSAHETNLDKG